MKATQENSKIITPLENAYAIQQTARKTGFAWPNSTAIFTKLDEEAKELKIAIQKNDIENIEEEIGDLLFTIINFCCHLNVDPQIALNKASDKFKQRFQHLEEIARKNNINMALSPLTELQALWNSTKNMRNSNE